MHNVKYTFELKCIYLENVLNLFPLEVAQKCQRCRLCVLREISRSELDFGRYWSKFARNMPALNLVAKL